MNGVRKVGTTSVCTWVVSASRPSHRIHMYVVQVAMKCTKCVRTGYLKCTSVQHADTISALNLLLLVQQKIHCLRQKELECM